MSLIDYKKIETSANSYLKNLGWKLGVEIDDKGMAFKGDYAQYAFFGRSPGKMPPVASIKSWIDEHNLDLNAYAVARNIAKFGTKPDPTIFDEFVRVIAESAYAAVDYKKIIGDITE